MSNERERCFKQEPEAEAHHGRLVAICDYVQLAYRFVTLFGEPAKRVVKQLANTLDLYSTSPHDEAHKTFERKVDDLGHNWKNLTKAIVRSETIAFAKQLGVKPSIIEEIKVPKEPFLRELYKRREEIKRKLGDLDEDYNAKLQAIEEDFKRCLSHCRGFIRCVSQCIAIRKKRIDELNRKYNSEKLLLLHELQELDKTIAEMR